MGARYDRSGPLAAALLGAAALAGTSLAPGQTSAPAPARADTRPEVVITATRESDAQLSAKVEQALQNDPYLFTGHIDVSAENGVVRVEGIVEDPFDMLQILRLARRIAGKRRVINEIQVMTGSVDHD